jgi:hypothetical protein
MPCESYTPVQDACLVRAACLSKMHAYEMHACESRTPVQDARLSKMHAYEVHAL